MNIRLFFTFVLLGFGMLASAQSYSTFSLTRPQAGGDLSLVAFDLANGTETVLKIYDPVEISDYNPEVTTFDAQNNRFITVAYDLQGDEKVIAINTANGNIEHSYLPVANELHSLEFGSTTVFSLARPMAGGDLMLLSIDLAAGTETVVKTYTPSELFDFNPEATTFDRQNNRFITIDYTMAGAERIVAINTANGNIEHTYTSAAHEIFSLEHGNNGLYALARPATGGNLRLLSINLAAGTETLVKAYTASELPDFDPEATTFAYQANQLVTIAYGLPGGPHIVAIDAANGNIVHSFASAVHEFFALEAGGTILSAPGSLAFSAGKPSLYPNPATTELRIRNAEFITSVEIYNAAGSSVMIQQPINGTINTSALQPGIYLVRLQGTHAVYQEKLVKQ